MSDAIFVAAESVRASDNRDKHEIDKAAWSSRVAFV